MNKSYVYQHEQTSKCNVNHNLLHYIPSLLTYSYHSKNFFLSCMSKFSISTGLSPWACNLLSLPFLMFPSSYHPISCYFTAEFFERVDYTWYLQFPCPLPFFVCGGEGAVVTPVSCGDLSSQSRDWTHAPCLGSRES